MSLPAIELTPEQESIIFGLLTNAFENPMWDEDREEIGTLIDLFEDRIGERENLIQHDPFFG